MFVRFLLLTRRGIPFEYFGVDVVSCRMLSFVCAFRNGVFGFRRGVATSE